MSTTTILGILTILGAIINAAVSFIKGTPIEFGVTIAAITAGIGLIKSADSKTVEAGAKASEENRKAINANSAATGAAAPLPAVPKP
jgi:hypothetical protein